MTEFHIPVPYRDRRDPLDLEAVDVADALEGDERRMAHHLLWEASLDPHLETVGDLINKIERASPEERRQIADEARAAAGLPSVAEAKSRRELALAQRDDPPTPQQGPPRDYQGMAVQECAHADCTRLSVNEVTHVVGPVAARRWHCPEHEGEAAEGDMDPWTPPPVTYGPAGGLISEQQVKDEAAYYERLVRESREKALRRQERNRAERERLEHLQKLRDREAKPLNLGGIEVGPGGKILNEPEPG
jgi:hypothetical protein